LIFIHDSAEVLQSRHEFFGVLHHFDRRFPFDRFGSFVLVDLDSLVPMASHQIHTGREHFGHSSGRVGERLSSGEIFLLNSLQGSLSFLYQRHGSVQISLGGLFLESNIGFNLSALSSLDVGLLVFSLDFLLFNSHNGSEFLSLGLLLLSFHTFDLDSLLNFFHLLSSVFEFDQSVLVSLLAFFKLGSLDCQHRNVEFDQFEERFRSGIDESLLLLEHLLAHVVHLGERSGHEFDHTFSDLFITKVHILQEGVGDGHQSIIGPGLEPIDDRIVDKGRELSGSLSETLTHGRETKRHM